MFYICLKSISSKAAQAGAMVLFGGLSGGVSSHLAGGSFAQGFSQGIITAGLNHAMHGMAKEWQHNHNEPRILQVVVREQAADYPWFSNEVVANMERQINPPKLGVSDGVGSWTQGVTSGDSGSYGISIELNTNAPSTAPVNGEVKYVLSIGIGLSSKTGNEYNISIGGGKGPIDGGVGYTSTVQGADYSRIVQYNITETFQNGLRQAVYISDPYSPHTININTGQNNRWFTSQNATIYYKFNK